MLFLSTTVCQKNDNWMPVILVSIAAMLPVQRAIQSQGLVFNAFMRPRAPHCEFSLIYTPSCLPFLQTPTGLAWLLKDWMTAYQTKVSDLTVCFVPATAPEKEFKHLGMGTSSFLPGARPLMLEAAVPGLGSTTSFCCQLPAAWAAPAFVSLLLQQD